MKRYLLSTTDLMMRAIQRIAKKKNVSKKDVIILSLQNYIDSEGEPEKEREIIKKDRR